MKNNARKSLSVLITILMITSLITLLPVTAMAASNNAALSSLTLSDGILSPVFDPATTTYTASVTTGVTTGITVTPTASDPAATISVNGSPVGSGAASQNIPIGPGNNAISVTVTAADGTTTQTYDIMVSSLSNDATLQQVSLIYPYTGTEVMATIDETAGTVSASVTGQDQTLSIIPNSPAATYIVKNTITPGWLTLNMGVNTFTIEVTAEDGTVKDYTLTIERLPSADATAAWFWVNPYGGAEPVQGTIDNTADTVTATVYGQNHTISIQPTIFNSTWVLKQGGVEVPAQDGAVPISLNVGDTNYTLEITADDGVTKKTYAVTITRAVSNVTTFYGDIYDAAMNNEGRYVFTDGATVYASASGPDHFLAVTPFAQNTSIVVKDQAGSVIPFQITGYLNAAHLVLAAGDNTFTIESTAEDGTKSTSTLVLTKVTSADATLSSVLVYTPADMWYEYATVDNTNGKVNAQTYGAAQTLTILPTVATSTWILKKGGIEIPHTNSNVDITLAPGNNNYTIEVTAEDGTAKTYSMNIKRMLSTKPYLLDVSTYSSSTGTAATIHESTKTASAWVTSALQNIYATPQERMTTVNILDSTATDVTNQPVTLNPGDNLFTITLTTENGATRTYQFTLTLYQATDAALKSLTVDGTAVAGFSPDVMSYDLGTVSLDKTQITIGATARNSMFATVSGTGVQNLDTGLNTFHVTVTPQVGAPSDYTLTVTRAAATQTVTFDSAGGTPVASITQAYGSAITPPADPTKDGYTFTGWSPAVPATMPLNGANLTAQWTANNYTITFDSAGGMPVASITQAYGSAITPPADPTKDGYTFAGWSPAMPATMPLNGANLTAQWTANDYTITFDSNGGTPVASITQAYGSTITALADPTKDGYTFAGWSPAVPATMPLNGAALTAKWLDANANLSNLTVDGVQVAGFSANTASYTLVVPNPAASVTIAAAAESAKAVTTGDTGTKALVVGQNTFTITVTAESGTSKLYTLNITRDTAPIVKPYVDGKLSDILLTPGATLSQTFSWDTTKYDVNLTETTSSVSITPVRYNNTNNMTIDGRKVTSRTYNNILATKPTVVKIVVVLNKTKTTYTLTIRRAKSTNADLSKLTVTGGSLNTAFSNANENYSVLLAENRSTVTIKATNANSYAVISINGRKTNSRTFSIPNGGGITVTVTCTAQKGNSRSWNFIIARAPKISTFSAAPKIARVPTVQPGLTPLTFTYALAGKGGYARLEILTAVGWVTLSEGTTTPGTKRFTWDGMVHGTALPPGTYTVRLSAFIEGASATPRTLTINVK